MKSKALCIGLAFFAAVAAEAGTTLDNVKKKGFVQCGVSTGVPGFSNADSKGEWTGIDVDMCRAVAAMVFNDARKFKVTSLNTQQRFTALQSGEIDLLSRNTTLTLTREFSLGLVAAGVNFYNSQGVLVKKSLGVKSAKELNGATICVQPGTTTELNLADYFRAEKLTFKPVVIDKYDESVRAFTAGRCDAYTTDKSALAVTRISLGDPENYVILPEELSKEPNGPMVRQGDDQWLNIVRYALNAMLEAEEYGITSKNVDEQLKSANPNVQRILGVTPGLGKAMGLDDRWAYSIIKQVGNYGESFERNLGAGSAVKLPRGLNAQWRQGGLMYGLPLR